MKELSAQLILTPVSYTHLCSSVKLRVFLERLELSTIHHTQRSNLPELHHPVSYTHLDVYKRQYYPYQNEPVHIMAQKDKAVKHHNQHLHNPAKGYH